MPPFDLFVHRSDEGGLVADVLADSGGDTVEVPVQVADVAGELVVTLFSPEGGSAWTYPLADFRDALDRAAEAVRDGG